MGYTKVRSPALLRNFTNKRYKLTMGTYVIEVTDFKYCLRNDLRGRLASILITFNIAFLEGWVT